MIRPATTGLATAFFRLYLLERLSGGPAQPASLLALVGAERLPLANGGFSRALQSLVEGGYLAPTGDGMVGLTAQGAAARLEERERWSAVLPTVIRLLGGVTPPRAPVVTEAVPLPAMVADAYAERVLVAHLRDRVAAAREGGRVVGVVLLVIRIDHPAETTRRAMVHRAIRASLGNASTLFGGDVTAFRYGDAGIALVAPRPDHGRLATLGRTRIDELLRSMTANVRAFNGARWRVHAGGATWSIEIGTTGALLRAAEDALRADGEASTAA